MHRNCVLRRFADSTFRWRSRGADNCSETERLLRQRIRDLSVGHDKRAAFCLHLFGGLSVEEAGTALGVSRAVAYRNWKYARAWLREALEK